MSRVLPAAACSALIVAAGQGTRLGANGPKAFVELHGRPMLAWAIDALREAGVGDIVVAVPPAGAPRPAGLPAPPSGTSCPADGALGLPDGVRLVCGGAERSHSVRAALAVSEGDPVLVHDAARPMLEPALVSAALDAVVRSTAGSGGQAPEIAAAIAAAPVTDTVKRSPDGRRVEATLDRSELWAVQTPQVFRRHWLERALAQPDDVLAAATDDASLVEQLGGTVVLVPSGPGNLKVTTPHDLRVAELLLSGR